MLLWLLLRLMLRPSLWLSLQLLTQLSLWLRRLLMRHRCGRCCGYHYIRLSLQHNPS
jgi:hypothetical protein